MRYEDVQDYILFQDMFQARCEEVCGLLAPLNYSYRYLDEFEISNNEVWGEGDEYLGYGETDRHSAKFPTYFYGKMMKKSNNMLKMNLKSENRLKKLND